MWWKYALGILLFAVIPGVCLFFIITGLLGDPAKGRKRCRKCWRSLEGVAKTDDGWICPHCATLAAHEKHLDKTRRRWWRIGLCSFIVLAIGGFLYAIPVSNRWPDEGAGALVPSTLLVLAYPRNFDALRDEDSTGTAIDLALSRRLPDLWDWQRDLIPAPSIEHADPDPAHVASLPDVWAEGVPIPITYRMRNVSGGLLTISHSIRGMGPYTGGASVEALPTGTDAERLWADFDKVSDADPLPLGVHTRDVHVTSRVYDELHCFAYERVYEADVTLGPVRIIPLEEAIGGAITTPVRDKTIDDQLRSLPWCGFGRSHNGVGMAGPFRTLDYKEEERFGDLGVDIAINVQLVRNGHVLHEQVLHHNAFRDEMAMVPNTIARTILAPTRDECERTLGEMTVRLTPMRELVLLDMTHRRYWTPADGAAYLEIPLAEVLRHAATIDGYIDPLSPEAEALRDGNR